MSGETFFDFQQRMARKTTKPPASAAPSGEAGPMTVSQLTAKIDRVLKTGLPASVLVKGEISNFKLHGGSGHSYFTLKDAGACVNCVMWRSDAARLKFQPKDGMELLARGSIAVYAQQGKYQLYVTTLQPLGQGALELAFQQLRAKLQAEGLFAAARKKALPMYPLRIALVTSRQTAALADMLKVLQRYAWLRLFLYHVPVQGEGSAAKIAAAITHLSLHHEKLGGVDVILLARGGGSLEDLWEFNEEVVARAIVASVIPIVTGIGHEIDISIADLAADHHAHTPTEAAQTIVQRWKIARDLLEAGGVRLRRGVRELFANMRQRLAAIERHELFRRPLDRVRQLRQLLDDRQRALALGVGHRLRLGQRRINQLNERLERRHPTHQIRLHRGRLTMLEDRLRRSTADDIRRRSAHLAGLQGKLEALGPQNVLRRGYSITKLKKSGAIVRNAVQLKPGDRLITRFADGIAESVVEDSKQLPLFE